MAPQTATGILRLLISTERFYHLKQRNPEISLITVFQNIVQVTRCKSRVLAEEFRHRVIVDSIFQRQISLCQSRQLFTARSMSAARSPKRDLDEAIAT